MDSSTKNFSKISVRTKGISKTVQITSDDKPDIISSVLDKWQSLVDTIANIVNVPSGMIMRLNKDSLEVFLTSQVFGNPAKAGAKDELIYGLYCETVIGTQSPLLVPDARKSPIWAKNNPDIDINLVAYLGYPINWPDGEVFGTVCLLDTKENHYSKNYSDLLLQVKQLIENDLKILELNHSLIKKNQELESLNSIKTRFLSLISHDIRGGLGTLDEFLKLAISEFDTFEPDDLKKILSSLSQSTSSSHLALESLLSWSKKDFLQLVPEKKQFDLIPLIQNIYDYFKHSLEIKNIKVNFQFHQDQIQINADQNMIKVALRNIIANSIKHTHKDGTIDMVTEQKEENIMLKIIDNGEGMTQNTLEKLFQYDESIQKQGTSGESTTGIGLIITKEFLDKNDISVQVKSQKDKGTQFEVVF